MRILDNEYDKALNDILICMTIDEAKELYDSLKLLMKDPSNNHTHITSDCLTKEISICLYEDGKLEGFNDRTIKLIKEDI